MTTATATGDIAIRLRRHRGLIVAVITFAVLYGIYNFNHPRGFSSQVMVQNSTEAFSLVMLAMAQTMPVLMGAVDLSVGAVMTLCNCLASVLLSGSPLQIALGAVLCLAAGTAFGAVNGLIVVYGRLQPIIATLATGAVAIGIALYIRPTPGGSVDDDLSWALTNTVSDFLETYGLFPDGLPGWARFIGAIPVPLIMAVILAFLCRTILARTVIGRTIYAIGSSEGAAYMSGLPVARAKIAAFALSGFFAACGGLFFALQTSSGNADIPQAGAYTLNSIAAVVLGGTSLMGGSGGAIASLFGALILRTISFSFRIFSVDPLIQPLVEGGILLAIVSFGAVHLLRVKNTLELVR